jgi:NADH-quinone oxidoreductase subunit H
MNWLSAHSEELLTVLKLLLVLIPISLVPLMILMERRGAAFIQDRPGPNRAAIPIFGLRIRGFGMVHNFSDAIKLFFKESFIPPFAHKPFYLLAPAIPVITAVLTPALIPWFSPIVYNTMDGVRVVEAPFFTANAGILALFALSSLSVYGIVLGSWGSNSKFSLLGGMRASAMMISYEVSMGLGVLGLFLVVTDPYGHGTFSLTDIVEWQAHHAWGVVVQPIGFLLFLVSMFAETNRNPFDVAEGESEIVAGYHTEYSAVKFALYFMGEYCHIVIASALIATLFFGGYHLPFLGTDVIKAHIGLVLGAVLALTGVFFLAFSVLINGRKKRYQQLAASDKQTRVKEYSFFIGLFTLAGFALMALGCLAYVFIEPQALDRVSYRGAPVYPLTMSLLTAAVQIGIVFVKTLFFCWLFVWVRWTLPRMRYDQIMSLGWKVMLNIALVNLLITAVVVKLVRG